MRQFCFIYFLLTILSSNAQTFNYRNYTVEDGLASSNVYVAIQDRKGFMWFATENGINRFDGNSFEHFSVEDGLSDNDVFRIFEDSMGRIWFLTSNGHLSFYMDGKIHNEKTDAYLVQAESASGFYFAFEDSRDRIWFCSINSQISVVKGNDVIRLHAPASMPEIGVGVFEDSAKNINVLCDRQRSLFNEENNTLNPISSFPLIYCCSHFSSPNGQLHFFSIDKVYQVNNGSINMVIPLKNLHLTYNDVLSVTNGNNNSIYVCTRKGAINTDPQTLQTRKYLTDKWINSVTVDKEDNIWFMTRGNGIYLLPKQFKEEKIYNNTSLSSDDIHSLAVGKNGSIWMGCANNTVSVLENDSIINIFPKIRFGLGRVTNMDADKQGNIWCCSDNSFYKINSSDHSVKLPPDWETIRTLNVTFNSKGNCVVAMHYSLADVTENKDHLNINRFSDTFLIKRPYCAFYDITDHLFISNVNGLYEMMGNKIVRKSSDSLLMKTKIISICQAKDSSLILGTDGYGVFFYKDGKVTLHLTSKQGLTSSVCRKIRIYEDKVFVCTNRGLTQFTFHNGEADDFKIYGAPYGLPSGDVRDVVINKGMMYVATSKGLAVLEEDAPLRTVRPPGLYIKEVLNNAKHINFDSVFTVPFKNNTLTIKYSAITYTNQDDVIYEYSIHENEKEIKLTSLTELTFPDISPGNYKFAIRAKKKNSEWSAYASFAFKVEYPYYQRWWFYLFVILTLMGGLSLVFIYFHRRSMRAQLLALEKRNALNLERNRISADMHDDLGADLSRIVVLTELIKLHSKDDEPVHSNTSKISEYAIGATKKMDEIIWALNPEDDTLQSLIGYINQYCFNFFEGTDTKVEIGTDEKIIDYPLNAKQRRNIFLVIKEIANNTLKFAKAKTFFISFKMENDILHIKAGDNGRGFDENELKDNGNGLENISNRIIELRGTVSRKSALLEGTWYEISLKLSETI